LDLELGCGEGFISTLVPPRSASTESVGKCCDPKEILKPDRAPQEDSRAKMFDITGNSAEHHDLNDNNAYDNNHMDYVPDTWLNALLDEQEANDATQVVVCEAASSSSQAPSYVISDSVKGECSAKTERSKHGKLTAEQLARIDRNRQIALALQMSRDLLSDERPPKSHRINFDDSGDEHFQDQPDLRHELNDASEPNFRIRRRKLLTKSSPIGTGYPMTALVSRATYKVQMEQRKNILRDGRHDKRIAANAATSLPARHQLVTSEASSSSNVQPMIPIQKPHASHDIAALPNHAGIIWCRRCAAWSKNVKLKALGKACEGLKDGNKGQLRLLQVGIAPYSGVRMPRHLSRVSERGRRRR